MKIFWIPVVLMLLVATNGTAQNVRGIVSESGGITPLAGAFVVLLDSANHVRAGTLSDNAGRFFMRAPHAGRFALRAELIGHETLTSASFVASGTEATVMNLLLPVAAVKLEALQVSGERRCRRSSELAKETARVWEEARKALTVAVWAENEKIARFEARSFERVLDPRTFLIRSETVKTVTSTNKPYAAISTDTLAQYGFVRAANDTTAFYGPDAEVLLSDAFLDTHCFSLRRSDREAPNLIGLTFEPVPGRKVQDIRGTLWVDPLTSELKFIDFSYTDLPHDINVKGVGGRTDFRHLPNGAWIVDRWYIRLPSVQRAFRGRTVAALVEGGGEIVNAHMIGSNAEALRKLEITGVVYDSIRGAPLGNATVYLSGTAYRTVTDSTGRFTISDITEGHYVASFWHASFDSLPALPESKAVRLVAQAPEELTLAIPSLPTLLERTCEGVINGGVLTGYVRDEDGNVLADEMVNASYKLKGRTIEQQRESDRSGRFVFCGLPLNTDVLLKTADGASVHARVGAARFVRKDVKATGYSARTRD